MLNKIFNKIDDNKFISPKEVIYLLKTNKTETNQLFLKADAVRKTYMGDEVYLRGIIEISNICKRKCNYCGIRVGNNSVERYRMPADEILETCKKLEKNHQTTVVLQSGEDTFYSKELFGEIIERIKKETNLAITVSIGKRNKKTYQYWHKKGMDRYLIRFETSNEQLFKEAHPDDNLENRLNCIKNLQDIGVQTGSGFLIGLPKETYQQLASDILFCTKLNLDMIGVGPFISHRDTPFKKYKNSFSKDIFYKVISILRILNKKSHIPSTTAFDAIDPNGRNLLLQRGANIFMPNSTPQKYRDKYQLYPGKPCVDESGEDCAKCTLDRITRLNRKIGTGFGHSIINSY